MLLITEILTSVIWWILKESYEQIMSNSEMIRVVEDFQR